MGIVTCYGMEGQGIEFPVKSRFSASVQTGYVVISVFSTVGTSSVTQDTSFGHPPHLTPDL